MFRGLAVTAALLVLLGVGRADNWQVIEGCRLIENESNDGDSFHVEADGEERIFRLYFVDTPEAESGGYVEDRVAEQAQEFGISTEASIAMGKKAAAFTRAVLSRPFKVTTRGQNAMGASSLPREYAFVETADGEDLGEMLITRGMARSFGQVAALRPYTAGELRDRYDYLEAKARREGVGAWGKGAAAPTRAIAQAPENHEESRPHVASREGNSGESRKLQVPFAGLYEKLQKSTEDEAASMSKSSAAELLNSLEAQATGGVHR